MKNILFLISILFLFSCEEEEDVSTPFYVDENGVTIKAKDWVTVGTTGVLNGITYMAIDDSLISISDFKSKYPEIKELKQLVTTLVTDMSNYGGGYMLIYEFDDFKSIETWDVSNVISWLVYLILAIALTLPMLMLKICQILRIGMLAVSLI